MCFFFSKITLISNWLFINHVFFAVAVKKWRNKCNWWSEIQRPKQSFQEQVSWKCGAGSGMYFWKHPPWIPSCASCPLVIALQRLVSQNSWLWFLEGWVWFYPLFSVCCSFTEQLKEKSKYWGGNEPKCMYVCAFIYILLSITLTSRVSSIARGTIYSLGLAWACVE